MGVGVGWTQGSMHGVGVGLEVKVWGIFFLFVCNVLISKVYLIRVVSFIGGLRFNVRGEHVQSCIGSG